MNNTSNTDVKLVLTIEKGSVTVTEDEKLLKQLLAKQKEEELKPRERFDIPCQDMPAQDAVPPLREVASRPYATRNWLTGWLTDPHPPMPKLNLTRREIDDLVSYVLTLRPPR